MLPLLRRTRCPTGSTLSTFNRTYATAITTHDSPSSSSSSIDASVNAKSNGKASAIAAPYPSKNEAESSSNRLSAMIRRSRVAVKDDHGLYAFFRKKIDKDGELEGEDRYESLGGSKDMEMIQSGRSWRASELRLKSFRDLHTLWYVILRERNLLATQKVEAKRIGAAFGVLGFQDKERNCRKSMARIKAVMNERRLAYEGAVALNAEEAEAHLDNVVLEHKVAEFNKERKYLVQREALKARRRAEKEGTAEGTKGRSGKRRSAEGVKVDATEVEVAREESTTQDEPVQQTSAAAPSESESVASESSEVPSTASEPTEPLAAADSKQKKQKQKAHSQSSQPESAPAQKGRTRPAQKKRVSPSATGFASGGLFGGKR